MCACPVAAQVLWLGSGEPSERSIVSTGLPADVEAICADRLRRSPCVSAAKVEVTDTAVSLGDEGFRITATPEGVSITARTPRGALYGVYEATRCERLGRDASQTSVPYYPRRILNHWDNLDGTVERGYAGRSIWKWEELPGEISPQVVEYACACASVGINGTVLNNVNASPKMLTRQYLKKVKALADFFRPYGIRVYLSVNFATPAALGQLKTADPLNAGVGEWWKRKADEIYRMIPDFGGFLVKANSEGQPGPMDYGRTHADGANMLARALQPHGGIVMWRAFVYSPTDADRAKQAVAEFVPLDGKFEPNVIVQTKNGPIDFQPREPYHPLFDALQHTAQMAELQITQEYLGHANHLAFLGPMWREFFGEIIPGCICGVAGVANVGDSGCLTGNPMAQANWYAFGRQAWNPMADPQQIAMDWADLSVWAAPAPEEVKRAVNRMMISSREAVVDYMMPLGLHHIFAFGHHYGPEPWCDVPGAREDWLPRYYHRADSAGLGFDRTATGSDAVSQYRQESRALFADRSRCPEKYLLWFHHVGWDERLSTGRTLWEELCHRYQHGVDRVEQFNRVWAQAEPYVAPGLHADCAGRLHTQLADARWWRDACLQYFAAFSRRPVTAEVDSPAKSLDELKQVRLGIDNYTSAPAALLDSVR